MGLTTCPGIAPIRPGRSARSVYSTAAKHLLSLAVAFESGWRDGGDSLRNLGPCERVLIVLCLISRVEFLPQIRCRFGDLRTAVEYPAVKVHCSASSPWQDTPTSLCLPDTLLFVVIWL